MAYQLASPANRAFTASPDGYNENLFGSMVNGDVYKHLLSGYGYTVSTLFLIGNSIFHLDLELLFANENEP